MSTISCTCGKSFNVSPKHAGKTLTCPECRAPIHVPDGSEPQPVAPPTPPDLSEITRRLDTLLEITDRCRDHLSRLQARISLALIIAALFIFGPFGVVVLWWVFAIVSSAAHR